MMTILVIAAILLVLGYFVWILLDLLTEHIPMHKRLQRDYYKLILRKPYLLTQRHDITEWKKDDVIKECSSLSVYDEYVLVEIAKDGIWGYDKYMSGFGMTSGTIDKEKLTFIPALKVRENVSLKKRIEKRKKLEKMALDSEYGEKVKILQESFQKSAEEYRKLLKNIVNEK